MAKKKKKAKANPWAICHSVIKKKKNPKKFERCVKKVKKRNRAT